jgi:phage I-like protein
MTAASLIALLASLDLPAAEAPDWVHLLPSGKIGTTDARGPYHVTDPAAIIAASFADTDRLPIDENHSTDLAAPRGEPAPARGWIVAMEARADGIWGRVEWNAAGTALLADRAYRGISPVILHDKSKAIHSILRASLVNRPNIRGLTALHQEENGMTLMQKLIETLGLAADATEDQAITALNAKMTGGGTEAAMQSALTEIGLALGVEGDTAAIVAAAKGVKAKGAPEIVALQSEIAALTTQLNSVTEVQARDRATAFVDGEIKRGRAGVKPLRDHYIAMHMADAARVEKEIGALPVLGSSGMTVLPPAPKDGEIALNAAQRDVAAILGIDPKTYAETLKSEQKEAR